MLGGGGSATLGGSPRIQLTGYNIGTPTNLPQIIGQRTWQIRDDFTWSFEAGGRHDVRMGGEFLEHNFHFDWCSICNGNLQANSGGAARRPTQAQLGRDVPEPVRLVDVELQRAQPAVDRALPPVGRRLPPAERPARDWRRGIQDDWRVSQRLTLNLGIRWDADLGIMGEKKKLLPWMSGDRPHQLDWFAPRVGFAYQPQRSDGDARRIRQVLHAARERRRASVEPEHPDDHPGGRVRRPRRLRR